MIATQLGENQKLNIVLKFLEERKNEYGDVILIVRIKKTGQIQSHRRFFEQITVIIQLNDLNLNEAIIFEIKLLYKESDYREEIDVMENKIDPQGSIQLDISHGSIENIPIFYQQGMQDRKVKSLYGIIHKLLEGDRRRKNLYICDGKNDELCELCKDYLNLSNVESGCNGQSVKQFERLKIMEYRYENRERTSANGILCYYEFAALRITIDKKEFAEINDSLRRIILISRAANIHIIMALQRPETSVLDEGQIIIQLELGQGNLKDENYKMVLE